ncbi:SirB2 family protein [uncultured Azonexus sp.]|uniref:SirB2 family protein n=1 Tax=uncultured Azonexus sp. TaxID=520307 RepID=UPI00262D4736|nr:SirB2 family protein [uncultured Azonexus sp.]
MSYVLLKHLHVTCVVLSGTGFLLRLFWMWRQSPWLQRRISRVLPHVVDSLLLLSALSLAWISGQYPFAMDWLTAKLIGLLLYIGCGMMALKRGRTMAIRLRFGGLAVLAYGYIVAVALTRQPLPFV